MPFKVPNVVQAKPFNCTSAMLFPIQIFLIIWVLSPQWTCEDNLKLTSLVFIFMNKILSKQLPKLSRDHELFQF